MTRRFARRTSTRVRTFAIALALGFAPANTACVRAPAPIDVAALVARHGAEDARRELTIRVLASPRDIAARLALATLAEQGRPAEAIEQLEAVYALDGPLGPRWHADDRARLARLLLARARVRLARGAPSALADLERARELGAAVGDAEIVSGEIAIATAAVRHVDHRERARGRATLARHASARASATAGSATSAGARTEEAAWRGAHAAASPEERGRFGQWLWEIGARREAYEQLARWHAGTAAPRDEQLQSAYLRAYAWWIPLWLGERPAPPASELVGPERCWFPGADCVPPAEEPPPLPPVENLSGLDAASVAIVRYAATRTTTERSPATTQALAAIVSAYRRSPVIADRLGRDLVARSTDAAAGYATLGALFDALGDPARARTAWQLASARSAEVPLLRGLAEATARTGDGPAALVFATTAAAASGDPAVVWTAVSAALLESGQLVDALTAARSALDLAGPNELPRALDLAIELSRLLGRDTQADAMRVQRALLAHAPTERDAEVLAALAEHRTAADASTAARLWAVSRQHPRTLELRVELVAVLDDDDPRRRAVADELVELAGEPSTARALAAVRALRR
jgi:hypothetical protein